MQFKTLTLATTSLVALGLAVGSASAGNEYAGKFSFSVGNAWENYGQDGGESDFDLQYPTLQGSGSVNVPIGGFSVLYERPFNGGNGSQPWPLPQITLLNAMPGDDLLLTAQTRCGFTVRVVNGSNDVARQINWISQGY